MTKKEIAETKEFQRYGTKVSDESQDVLDLLRNAELLGTTPFREAASALCCANLAIIAKTPTETTVEEIDRGFRVAADTLSLWLGKDKPKIVNGNTFTDMTNELLGKILATVNDEVRMTQLLAQSTFCAAVGAAYEYYKAPIESVVPRHIAGMVDIVDELNELIVKLLEEYNKIK